MENRVALVTGSTSGIGLGIARCLASRGCHVIINGFADDELIGKLKEEFSSKYKGRIDYVSADLANQDEVKTMCQDINQIHPNGVDIVVNNAGFQYICPVEEFPAEKWDAMMAVMLTAPFLLTKYFIPDMKKKGWGRIINISSAHGVIASPNKSAYIACKHGIVGLTKAVALETAASGITCNAVCPGHVNTQIFQMNVNALAEKEGLLYEDAKKTFLGNFHATNAVIEIDQVAELVVFLCTDAASQMTGSSIVMDGGWTAK